MVDRDRRSLIRLLAGLPLLGSVAACANLRDVGFQGSRQVILVELFGGNDGLNTVVPFRHPRYAALRPNIAIASKDVIRIDDELGFHPALAPLMSLWESGELAVVQGVGYERPNRSHFRSQEIWETAADSDEILTEGWVGRALTEHPGFRLRRADAEAVALGNSSLGALLCRDARVVTMNDPRQYLRDAERLANVAAPATTLALEHLIKTQRDALATASALRRKLEASRRSDISLPGSALGRNLVNAVALIEAGVDVPVIKVTHSGFDTHANQLGRHDALLRQFARSMAGLREALVQIGRWNDTLVIAYSEFGRRVAENNSRGTDHGAAGIAFVCGGQVAGGLQGRQPSLDDLDNGDLRFGVDYRRLYATVLAHWWGQAENFLGARGHRPLPLLRGVLT